MATYCNITTDLDYVFSRIEEYRSEEIISSWTSYVAEDGSYYKRNPGDITALYDDGAVMTQYLSYASLIGDDNAWFYDTTTDILYIIISNGADPAGSVITNGVNWTTLKTDMRNRAQEIVDSYLNKVFSTPLIPRSRLNHTSNYYEYPIVEATACITCSLIIQRQNPNDPNAKALMRRAINYSPETGEEKGIINKLLDGDIVLQDQITARETGNWNIYPYSSNTVTYNPILIGMYRGNQYKIWRIQIDTGGAIGTATYKVSYDGGTTWDLTLQPTKDATDDEYRMYIADGIYVYWPDTTWVLNEYWNVELFPMTDTASGVKVSSITMSR